MKIDRYRDRLRMVGVQAGERLGGQYSDLKRH